MTVVPLLDVRTVKCWWPSLRTLFALLIMFHLTCLGWLLFRAQNVTTVQVFLRGILLNPHGSPETLQLARDLLFYTWFLLEGSSSCRPGRGRWTPSRRCIGSSRLNIWIFVIMSLFALGAQKPQAFIYFAF